MKAKEKKNYDPEEIKKLKVAMCALSGIFITGILAGIGCKVGYDKIFKSIPKKGVANIRNFPCKDGIGFLVYGKNLFGKEIIQAEGYTDIASWVTTFIGGMKDPTVGSKVSGLFMKYTPEIREALSKASPEVLKELGVSVKEF